MSLKTRFRFAVEQLEDRTNPDITLSGVPGDAHVPSPLAFDGFDNPSVVLVDFDGDGEADDANHPNFGRSPTAIAVTMGTQSDANGFGNEGPWTAHAFSPVITCTQC